MSRLAIQWLLGLAALSGGSSVSFAQPAPAVEFFIISSVDPAKEQLLVKRPTEVTEVMRVTQQTKYYDRAKKPIGLIDLRAGDTVYIASTPSSGFALEVRKGPMTVAELHRRYLPRQR